LTAPTHNLTWTVGCSLTFVVTDPVRLALQIAPADSAGTISAEHLDLALDPGGTATVIEVAADHGGRLHVVDAETGILSLTYSATLTRAALRPAEGAVEHPQITRAAIEGIRPSRFCPSDALGGFAVTEFGDAVHEPPGHVASRVAAWVFERLAYVSGASDALDTAIDTLVAGSGVCRDYAHLTIALCRALGVPARLAAVYAPGISPMDFHAVAEVLTPAGWQVFDATRLAPRTTLVRIATGRDAADTAFADTLRGAAELVASDVYASTDGGLPDDDHVGPVTLP
jgi:transglutaminase-like putative cysteine protease